MNIYNKKPLLVLVLLLLPMVAFANSMWPALIAEQKITSLPIIAMSLLIEYFFFKYLFKLNKKTSLYYTLAANAVSALFGVVLRPLLGLLWELSFGLIAYKISDGVILNLIPYISVPMLGGAVNALLELLTIRIIWKQKLNQKNYFLTWGINIVTIALAVVWLAM